MLCFTVKLLVRFELRIYSFELGISSNIFLRKFTTLHKCNFEVSIVYKRHKPFLSVTKSNHDALVNDVYLAKE